MLKNIPIKLLDMFINAYIHTCNMMQEIVYANNCHHFKFMNARQHDCG